MQKIIVILSSGHSPYDERIFWKFGRSLLQHGYNVSICSSTEDTRVTREGININSFDGKNMKKREKVNYFLRLLKEYNPDIIICCEPLTTIPSHRYKKGSSRQITVISDITEWYPENYTSKVKGLRKYAEYLLLWLFNIYSVQLTDALIIGEPAKKNRYDIIAPFKRKIIIGYFPVLEFFQYYPPPFDGKNLTLCYAGLISFRRGILTMVNICRELKERHPYINLTLKLAGKFETASEEMEFSERIRDTKSFKTEFAGWTDYPNISKVISSADICLDLRIHNFVHDNSLPIKVFEYMAAGKPFIFTDITPLRKLLGQEEFAHLVEPENTQNILDIIEKYLNSKNILLRHSEEARKLIVEKYNWEKESVKLVHFIRWFTGE